MAHADKTVKANVVMAVGVEKLLALSETRDAKGELVRAAQACWAAGLLKGLPLPEQIDLMYRAGSLLERANDPEGRAFELEVCGSLLLIDVSSERNGRAMRRQQMLLEGAEATFESVYGQFLGYFMEAFEAFGMFGGEENQWPNPKLVQVQKALEKFNAASVSAIKASEMAPHPSIKNSVSL